MPYKKILKICKGCKQEKMMREKSIYCSNECYYKHKIPYNKGKIFSENNKIGKCKTCGKEFQYYKGNKAGLFCSKKCEGIGRTTPPICRFCKKVIPKSERYNSKFNYWMRVCKTCGTIKNKKERIALKENPLKYRARMLRTCLLNTGIKDLNVKKLTEIISKPIKCVYCEKIIPLQEISVDHIIPKSRGGTNELFNIQFIDMNCNVIKGNLTDVEFKKLLKFLIQNPEIYEILKTRFQASGFRFKGYPK